MVKVRIKNMMFYGFHGYYEYEREQGQKFFFDVEMLKNDDAAVDSDNLNDGVDTAKVYDVVKYVTENKRFQLMAETLPINCLKTFRTSTPSRSTFASRACRFPAQSTMSKLKLHAVTINN